MTGPAAISANGLRFHYRKEEEILKGVDLEVQPGEIMAVIGPNGSGKTTLLLLLAWTLVPAAGEVRLFGEPMPALSPRERAKKLAMVPQDPTLAFPFTVQEIVLMGRAPFLGRWELEGRGDMKVAELAMAETGVAHLADRRFHELSGGERQRVMVAKALAQESKVLLLDEPTAFLDLKHQIGIYELVRGLARDQGLAVLAVSHDVNLSALFCDRVGVLAQGKIIASGKPADVLDPELLSRVYGVGIGVVRDPARGEAPLIFPLRESGAGGNNR